MACRDEALAAPFGSSGSLQFPHVRMPVQLRPSATFFITALLLLPGCSYRADLGGGDAEVGVLADSVRVMPISARYDLAENSGVAMAVRHPGVFYSINDSGNDPIVYAVDTMGVGRGRWTLRGAANRDWEAIAVGPCVGARTTATSCIYVGDVGDNGLERSAVVVYRTPEPDSLAPDLMAVAETDSIVVRYEDGAHNVEAMYVAPDGSIVLISKERQRTEAREARPTLMYRIAAAAWDVGAVAEARLVDSLPIIPRAATSHQVTDAGLALDGRTLAVRTYAQVLLFTVDPATGLPTAGLPYTTCEVGALGEPQGEGVGFVARRGTSARLVLTSERAGEPLRMVSCPVPSR